MQEKKTNHINLRYRKVKSTAWNINCWWRRFHFNGIELKKSKIKTPFHFLIIDSETGLAKCGHANVAPTYAFLVTTVSISQLGTSFA